MTSLNSGSDGSPAESTELAGLLGLAARGDQTAFAQFYDAARARAYGLAVRVVRNPSLADEVTQEAFLEIWRTASRFDPERGSAMSWLLTIVHRKAVDRVRSVDASRRRETNYQRTNHAVEHDPTAAAAQASMEARRVRSALEALTQVQREALDLAYFKGYTHSEVATKLNLPLGTAKTRIRDGLIRLRDSLSQRAITYRART